MGDGHVVHPNKLFNNLPIQKMKILLFAGTRMELGIILLNQVRQAGKV
jgi:hypothetical protein